MSGQLVAESRSLASAISPKPDEPDAKAGMEDVEDDDSGGRSVIPAHLGVLNFKPDVGFVDLVLERLGGLV